MRIAVLILAAAASALTAPAIAHPEHDMMRAPASPEQVARTSLFRMISLSKLPASWSEAKLVEAKARVFKGSSQTVVTFRNDAETNKARRSFYVVVADGEVVSSGHTLS